MHSIRWIGNSCFKLWNPNRRKRKPMLWDIATVWLCSFKFLKYIKMMSKHKNKFFFDDDTKILYSVLSTIIFQTFIKKKMKTFKIFLFSLFLLSYLFLRYLRFLFCVLTRYSMWVACHITVVDSANPPPSSKYSITKKLISRREIKFFLLKLTRQLNAQNLS